jgi:hypothetical protein
MLTQRICAGNSGMTIPRNGPASITTTSAMPPDNPYRRKVPMFA